MVRAKGEQLVSRHGEQRDEPIPLVGHRPRQPSGSSEETAALGLPIAAARITVVTAPRTAGGMGRRTRGLELSQTNAAPDLTRLGRPDRTR